MSSSSLDQHRHTVAMLIYCDADSIDVLDYSFYQASNPRIGGSTIASNHRSPVPELVVSRVETWLRYGTCKVT
jgi:hypothetical protein